MTTYKTVQFDQYEKMFDLANYAFNKEKTVSREKKFNKLCAISDCYGAFKENTLLSQLIVRPMEVYLHGQSFKMGGVGSVASYPENRGGGDIAKLMTHSLEKMHEKGQTLSYLAPFSYSFYRRYGYEQCFDELHYTIDVSELPKMKKTNGIIRRVRWEEAKLTLKEIYEKRYATSVGPLKRSEWDWEFLMLSREESSIAMYYDENGLAQGYLMYSFKGQTVGTFVLQEMVYLTQSAFKESWNFVSSHKASFHTFLYKAGAHEKIAYLFDNPRVKQELVPYMMARIVTFEDFLLAYPFKEQANKTFYLEVEDERVHWNAGVWKVELFLTTRKVTRLTDKEEVPQGSLLSGTIQSWTQVFMNYRTIEELAFFDRIQGEAQLVRDLSRRIPAGTPVLFDYF
ncbi:Predicted acetyltransferase [Carnobacterium iners]|uniref:Predicted acetyltransferase n=1 Tax=Carnobacterium iners TaxID=1073423 RepID=A0A1X7N6U6_9LACT|nr:GNAT family N-acetyltransferase [Carnobacterium iners]SEK44393.1 Predicted acetyltransferase [Carnobacterium iners]SMH32657.1 Predicted acetyltransferase [Carnobacterium iners]